MSRLVLFLSAVLLAGCSGEAPSARRIVLVTVDTLRAWIHFEPGNAEAKRRLKGLLARP